MLREFPQSLHESEMELDLREFSVTDEDETEGSDFTPGEEEDSDDDNDNDSSNNTAAVAAVATSSSSSSKRSSSSKKAAKLRDEIAAKTVRQVAARKSVAIESRESQNEY